MCMQVHDLCLVEFLRFKLLIVLVVDQSCSHQSALVRERQVYDFSQRELPSGIAHDRGADVSESL